MASSTTLASSMSVLKTALGASRRPLASTAARSAYTAASSNNHSWITTNGAHGPPVLDPFSSGSIRFDWRDRAASRRPRPPSPKPDETDGRRSRIKRERAAQHDLHPGERYYEEVQAYRSRFIPLLEAEEAEEHQVVMDRLSTWSLDKLHRNGYCLSELSAFWLREPHRGLPVATFTLGPGIRLPRHRFDKGTQVLVSRLDPLKEDPVKGSVLSCSDSQLQITFHESFSLAAQKWRLDVGMSNIAYVRMREAIHSLDHDPAEQEAASDDPQIILQGTRLRDIVLKSFSPHAAAPHEHVPLQAADDAEYPTPSVLEHDARLSGAHDGIFSQDQRIHSWVKRHSRPNPLRIEGDPELGLNESQTRAVAAMIGERLSLVQGPPGTGKTRTIIETIKLLKAHFQVPHPILVATYTNVAVDNLVEGLANAGVKPVRFGTVGQVKDKLAEHNVEHKLEQHPHYPLYKAAMDALERLRHAQAEYLKKNAKDTEQIAQAPAAKLAMIERKAASFEREISAARNKSYAIRQEMLKDVFAQADVVCTTCISAATSTLNLVDFPVVFLDEASMSTEPASLIPLMKGSQHVALIGDHKQLPPVITSREAQDKGLGISLFERLTEEGEVPSIMLNTQYRMHPAISRFPSGEFYNYLLRDGMVDEAGGIPERLSPPTSTHLDMHAGTHHRPSVIFLDHTGNESQSDRSRVNWNEAHIVLSVVEDLLLNNPHLKGDDIGIIAPYVAQISLLTRLLTLDAGYKARFRATLGEHRAMQLAAVEVKTVDGFEGREKDIIIFSTVRNNADGKIGFLADRRRLNVGLTRAKRGLFVVGSLNTLRMGRASGDEASGNVRVGRGGEAWQRYAQFLTDQKLVMRLAGPLLAQTLYGNLPSNFRQEYLGLRDVNRG